MSKIVEVYRDSDCHRCFASYRYHKQDEHYHIIIRADTNYVSINHKVQDNSFFDDIELRLINERADYSL